MPSIRAVREKMAKLEAEMQIADLPESTLCELEQTYQLYLKAAFALRESYEKMRNEGSDFPPYQNLVDQNVAELQWRPRVDPRKKAKWYFGDPEYVGFYFVATQVGEGTGWMDAVEWDGEKWLLHHPLLRVVAYLDTAEVMQAHDLRWPIDEPMPYVTWPISNFVDEYVEVTDERLPSLQR